MSENEKIKICMLFDMGYSDPEISRTMDISVYRVRSITNKHVSDKYPKLRDMSTK